MEMPIQIVITLFIVLVVGAMLLLFSQNILSSATKSLPTQDLPNNSQQILEVNNITNGQIAILVDECFKSHDGKVYKKETCFVMHSENPYLMGSFTDINSLVAQNGALKRVDGNGSVKTVLIKWNFIERGVEVSS